jgi:hypothetical protein
MVGCFRDKMGVDIPLYIILKCLIEPNYSRLVVIEPGLILRTA